MEAQGVDLPIQMRSLSIASDLLRTGRDDNERAKFCTPVPHVDTPVLASYSITSAFLGGLYLAPWLEASWDPAVFDSVCASTVQAAKTPRKTDPSTEARRFINVSVVPCHDSFFLTPQTADIIQLLVFRALLRRNHSEFNPQAELNLSRGCSRGIYQPCSLL